MASSASNESNSLNCGLSESTSSSTGNSVCDLNDNLQITELPLSNGIFSSSGTNRKHKLPSEDHNILKFEKAPGLESPTKIIKTDLAGESQNPFEILGNTLKFHELEERNIAKCPYTNSSENKVLSSLENISGNLFHNNSLLSSENLIHQDVLNQLPTSRAYSANSSTVPSTSTSSTLTSTNSAFQPLNVSDIFNQSSQTLINNEPSTSNKSVISFNSQSAFQTFAETNALENNSKSLVQQNSEKHVGNSYIPNVDNWPSDLSQDLICLKPSRTIQEPKNQNTILEVDLTSDASENSNDNSVVLFNQLIAIFPDADETFLRKLCKTHPTLNHIIDVILDMNNSYPRKTNSALNSSSIINTPPEIVSTFSSNNNNSNSVQCTSTTSVSNSNSLQFLSQIFPDADPKFLEEKSVLEDEKLKLLISQLLENNDYPKIVTKVPEEIKEESESDLGLYTTNFEVTKFLSVIKEPFHYYLDSNRECESSSHAVEFMKRRYLKHSIKIICQKYREFKYNLSKTCEFLDSEQQTRATKRQKNEIKMPVQVNLPFLQEACFVEHKQEIKEYIDKKENDRQQAYALAEKRGELIDCGCCYQSLLFEECATCDEGDLFCKACIIKGAEVRIGDGHLTFPCLINCPSSFSLNLLQELLDPQVFSRLIKRSQLEEVKAANIEGLEVCPFCEFATIPPSESRIFTCLNPECLKESCRQCHKISHIPKRCDEIESEDQERARKYIEDEMTRALVRECYKCKRSFIKVDGCNKMTCTCGAKMCYICREPVKNYDHFNGPGGDNTQRCPLYSTEQALHVDAVKDVAKKALEKVKEDNPDLQLKYDPTQNLPTNASTYLPPGVDENNDRVIQPRMNPDGRNDHLVAEQDPLRRQGIFWPPRPAIEDAFPQRLRLHEQQLDHLQDLYVQLLGGELPPGANPAGIGLHVANGARRVAHAANTARRGVHTTHAARRALRAALAAGRGVHAANAAGRGVHAANAAGRGVHAANAARRGVHAANAAGRGVHAAGRAAHAAGRGAHATNAAGRGVYAANAAGSVPHVANATDTNSDG